jgi:hypothetical protein
MEESEESYLGRRVFVNTEVSVNMTCKFEEASPQREACRRSMFTNAMLLRNRSGCIIILECQRGHAVYKKGRARVLVGSKEPNRELAILVLSLLQHWRAVLDCHDLRGPEAVPA